MPITAGSSQSANTFGTGTSLAASARMIRYSRSTACADGSSVPGGLPAQHVAPAAGGDEVGRVRLAAGELLDRDRTAERADAVAQEGSEPLAIELVLRGDRPRRRRGEREIDVAHRLLTRWPPSAKTTLPVRYAPASEASSSNGPVELVGAAEAALRDARAQLFAGLGGEEVAVQLGLHVAGGERVDANPVARQLERHRPGQMHHPGLRCAVRRNGASDALAGDRGDVDDSAAALGGDQAARAFLRHQPGALQVGVEDAVPVGLGLLEQRPRHRHAGVVDDHVGDAALGLDLVEAGLDAGQVGDVEAQRPGAAAGRLDLGDRVGELVDAARRDDHRRARLGQRAGEMLAEAARRAGHQRAPALEREPIGSAHRDSTGGSSVSCSIGMRSALRKRGTIA